jgi:HEAT repeat protein
VSVAIWSAGRVSEPSYLDRPLTYWMRLWQSADDEPPARLHAAFAAMDDRAVRWLVGRLDWKPSSFRASANKILQRFDLSWEEAEDLRENAIMSLGKMGHRARAAVPRLESLRTNSIQPRADAVRHAATAALILISGEPIQQAVERMLKDSSEGRFGDVALTLTYLGAGAVEAVPRMAAALDATNPPSVRASAAMALGAIHADPDIAVPALAASLATLETPVKEQVLAVLSGFGEQARRASPQVVLLLSHTNRWLAARASNTLAAIDPETAKRHGITKQEP